LLLAAEDCLPMSFRRLSAAVLAALVIPFPGQRARSEDATTAGIPAEAGRRLEVLFLGSENRFDHNPIARFRVIRKALGPKGINFTYSESLAALSAENLAKYDVLLVFANHDAIADARQQALLQFARNGGGCVFLHCAAGCFRNSNFDEYVTLLGAQFKSHETGVFRAGIVAPEHPIMNGWDGFECWDETYVHHRHAADRTILQRRGDEPWTWVHRYGEGRVYLNDAWIGCGEGRSGVPLPIGL
jgi:type 1 glutamine amidotransferase